MGRAIYPFGSDIMAVVGRRVQFFNNVELLCAVLGIIWKIRDDCEVFVHLLHRSYGCTFCFKSRFDHKNGFGGDIGQGMSSSRHVALCFVFPIILSVQLLPFFELQLTGHH